MEEPRIVGIDCEGVRLGRFGRLSLMQIALSHEEVALVDARVQGTIEALEPLLVDHNLVKVMHDCREDSSALFHQFGGIRMRGVFDTQTAGIIVQKLRNSLPLHQPGYTDLVREFFPHEQIPDDTSIKNKMSEDAELWHKRPLTRDLVDYAVLGVQYLVPLQRKFLAECLVGVNAFRLSEACNAWVEYCDLNSHLDRPADVEKIGFPLKGMVAAINDRGVYFKLNIGRTGVCCTPSALKRMLHGAYNFQPVQVGDTVELSVSGLSLDAKIVYVDRRDPDWEYFDFMRRPVPDKRTSHTEEYMHVPSVIENSDDIDPLLRRGLGKDGSVDSDGDDEVDHEPILTHKPRKRR